MFLVSLKSLKGKLVLLVAAVTAAVVLCVVFANGRQETVGGDSRPAGTALKYSASTQEERLNFIAQLGFTPQEDPESVSEVLIPEEFDEVYTAYNELQTECGFDLTPYKGCAVKKWTYILTDYPSYEDKDCIRLNLLVYKGKVIGGDICSVELDGFMTGLQENK